VTTALHDLASALRGEGLVTFTRQEPYVPEARRYGGPDAIAVAECLFCADSDSVADFIGSEPSEVQRLAMAARTIAAWWQHATCPSANLYPAMRAAQRALWPGERWPSKGVGQVWRAYQAEVAEEMRATGARAHGEAEVSALVGRARCGLSDKTIGEIIASVAHMHCNRLFACDNRRMEALSYEFALREMMRSDAVSQ
jgi:thiopeptide-type bacteriocin biosynthesis protein